MGKNKKEEFIIESNNGKKKVKFIRDKYRCELFISNNGWQWTGFEVGDEIMEMIEVLASKYNLGLL